jgi:hypothetical protein
MVMGEHKPDKYVVVCEGQECKNTANDVLSNIAHRLYQGILYFLNIVRLRSTHMNVISSVPVIKV